MYHANGVCSSRFKNGQGIAPNVGKYSLHENGTLEIKRVRPEDQGTYTFVASNILGKAEDQVRLEVKGEESKIKYYKIVQINKVLMSRQSSKSVNSVQMFTPHWLLLSTLSTILSTLKTLKNCHINQRVILFCLSKTNKQLNYK